jgi:hypothetical protein
MAAELEAVKTATTVARASTIQTAPPPPTLPPNMYNTFTAPTPSATIPTAGALAPPQQQQAATLTTPTWQHISQMAQAVATLAATTGQPTAQAVAGEPTAQLLQAANALAAAVGQFTTQTPHPPAQIPQAHTLAPTTWQPSVQIPQAQTPALAMWQPPVQPLPAAAPPAAFPLTPLGVIPVAPQAPQASTGVSTVPVAPLYPSVMQSWYSTPGQIIQPPAGTWYVAYPQDGNAGGPY